MSRALANLAYVRLAGDLEGRDKFLSQVLGLQKVSGREGDLAFRSDDRTCTVAVEAGEGPASVGVEVDDEAALDTIRSALDRAGFARRPATPEECTRRFVRSAVLAEDASGNRIDLVLRPARSGRRFFGSRDAGILGFSGVGLRSTDIANDTLFWTTAGATVSDRAGDITYLRFDDLHHRVALYPSERNGLLYATFAVESLDCIMQNFYHLQEHQVRVLQGPGRESASGQTFVRFADPNGQMFAFGCDMARVDEARHRPRQFGFDRYALCAWGSECRDTPELSVSP